MFFIYIYTHTHTHTHTHTLMEYYSAFKKKEGNLITCYNMDETWGHLLSEISYCKEQILCDSTYMRLLE